jgi:hypothetical protein
MCLGTRKTGAYHQKQKEVCPQIAHVDDNSRRNLQILRQIQDTQHKYHSPAQHESSEETLQEKADEAS